MKRTIRTSICVLVLSSLLAVGANAQSNLLAAGDFEAGTSLTTYWPTTTGVWGTESAALSGAANGITPFGSQMLQINHAGGGSASQTAQIIQGPFVAGSVVTFTAKLNTWRTGQSVILDILPQPTGVTVNGPRVSSPTVSLDFNTSTWQTVTSTTTLTTNTNYIAVEIRYSQVSGGLPFGTPLAYADDAVLTVVPPPTQTLTILGGSGNVGDFAANVEYYNPATSNWQPAYLVNYAPYGHPVTHPWGNIAGTNHWINYETDGASDPGAGPTTNQTLWYLYRVRFTVPTDAVNPKMTFSLKADNFAQVAINNVMAGGSTQFINNTYMNNVIVGTADQLNADAVFAQAVHPGENTITLNIGDWGGLNGFNFRIDLSMQSSQPLEIVPVPTNQPPVAVAGGDQSFTCVVGSANVTLNGSGSNDPNGDPLSYSWSLGSTVVSTQASFTTSLGSGSHTFTLTVSDGVAQSSDQVTVTVEADQTAPVLTVPDNIVVTANTSGGYSGPIGTATAEDACGLPVTITSDAPGTFPLGETTVQYSAVDVAGNVSTGSQTVTVKPYAIIVDIKPGSLTNVVNFKNKGVVPVAVLTTSDFDATTLNVASLKFGPGGAAEAHGKGHPEDVDHDGDIDLMLHFDTQATGLTNTDGSAMLVGTTLSGVPVAGSDVLNVGKLGKGSATDGDLTESGDVLPTEFNLGQNYPNPFNPSTTISYELPEPTRVQLSVFDMLGREVAVLVDGDKAAGRHAVRFNAQGLTSGIYVYRIHAGTFTQTRKFTLMK